MAFPAPLLSRSDLSHGLWSLSKTEFAFLDTGYRISVLSASSPYRLATQADGKPWHRGLAHAQTHFLVTHHDSLGIAHKILGPVYRRYSKTGLFASSFHLHCAHTVHLWR